MSTSSKTKSIEPKRKENDLHEEQPVKRKRMIDTKDRCNCRKGCSNGSCPCFKSTNGCNSSCKCKTSCENLFNHLDYIFGENIECSPHPCFADWLIKNIETPDQLIQIDRDALRKKIDKSERLELVQRDLICFEICSLVVRRKSCEKISSNKLNDIITRISLLFLIPRERSYRTGIKIDKYPLKIILQYN